MNKIKLSIFLHDEYNFYTNMFGYLFQLMRIENVTLRNHIRLELGVSDLPPFLAALSAGFNPCTASFSSISCSVKPSLGPMERRDLEKNRFSGKERLIYQFEKGLSTGIESCST